MKNFRLISQGLDTSPLMLAIQRRPELWKADTYLRDYPQGPFGEVDSIILRFPVKTVHETEEELKKHLSAYDQHENVDQPAYAQLPAFRKVVMDLMAYVGGERLGRVMINRIAPGGQIFAHADTPVHAEYWDRFHVVLESSPGVEFQCGDEQVYMPRGTVWWFDNREVHSVMNKSNSDRTHMIVDIRCQQ